LNILGINAYHGEASAALVVDGQLVAVVEERFTRLSSTPALLTTPSSERVRVAVGAEVPIEFTKRPKDDPQVRRPDISLAGLELGWEPKVPLDTGLERMVAWVSEAWTT
jgi:hypothetical protein